MRATYRFPALNDAAYVESSLRGNPSRTNKMFGNGITQLREGGEEKLTRAERRRSSTYGSFYRRGKARP